MKGFLCTVAGSLVLAAPAAVEAQFSYIATPGGTATITGYSGTNGVVVIPSSTNGYQVTSIGTNAFFMCYFLTSVTIPHSITNIGDYAFAACYALTNAAIPDRVISIGNSAFQGCGSLPNVIIPASVTSMGDSAFAECQSLASVTIPGNITSIGQLAFEACNNLGSVTIGSGVTSIGFGAFVACHSLTNVTIPASVTSIGVAAFQQCRSLDSLTIPNGVTSIGQFEFPGSGLTNVTIPASVTNIGPCAFETGSMIAITVDPQNSVYSSVNGVLFDKSQTTLVEYPPGAGASYTIPGSVTNIGSCAFYGCSGLTSLYFTGNAPAVFSVGPSAFYGCNATFYNLPGTTGWNAFSANTGLSPVLWNPGIQTGGGSFGVLNGQFGFNITNTANLTVVVEVCTNLASPVWVPLTTNTLVNGVFYFREPFQSNTAGRFYGLGLP